MLGWALPIRPGVTPAAVWAVDWFTSAASRQVSRFSSTAWPWPVRSRWRRAARMPVVANRPVITSTSATPTFCGSPSGAPVTLIRPPTAWSSRS